MTKAGEDPRGGATGETARRPRLLYLVKRWHNVTKNWLDEIAQEHELTSSEYTTLSFLERYEPCSAADLSRMQRITPQGATQRVAQLEAKGMIARAPKEANRRVSLIRLTGQGRARLTEISRRARAMEEAMLAELSPAQQDLVLGFVRHAITTAENAGVAPKPMDRVG